MPILPSVQHYITSEETEFEAPVSESAEQNIGEAINYLNDLFTLNFIEFTTAGAHAWVVPTSVTKAHLLYCGGGGGGGSGASGIGADRGGGGGGAGAYTVNNLIKLTPGALLTINIGAGGSGGPGVQNTNAGQAGGIGGNTIITGTGINLIAYGGGGGMGGGSAASPAAESWFGNRALNPIPDPKNGGGGGSGWAKGQDSGLGAQPIAYFQTGGRGGDPNTVGLAGSGGISFYNSLQSVGGARVVGGGGGGGGGSSFGIGGNGGIAQSLPNLGFGLPGTRGGGGGGSGAISVSDNNRPSGVGGAGGAGYLLIAWF